MFTGLEQGPSCIIAGFNPRRRKDRLDGHKWMRSAEKETDPQKAMMKRAIGLAFLAGAAFCFIPSK